MKTLILAVIFASAVSLFAPPIPPQVLTNQFTTNVIGHAITGDVTFGDDVFVGTNTYFDPDGSGWFGGSNIYWAASGDLTVVGNSQYGPPAKGLKIVDGVYSGSEYAYWQFTGTGLIIKSTQNAEGQQVLGTVENDGTNHLWFLRAPYMSSPMAQPNRVMISGGVGGKFLTSSTVSNADMVRVVSSIMGGTGSPEGVVAATVGTLYLRTDGGTTTTLYVKTSGVGNTGWTAK